MDPEELKKLTEALKAAGIDLSNKDTVNNLSSLLAGQKNSAEPAPPQAALRTDLSPPAQPQSSLDPSTRKALNDAIVQNLTNSGSGGRGPEYRPIRWPSGAVTYQRIPTPSKPKYGPDSEGRTPNQMGYDWGSTNDPLRGNRLDKAAERNKPAQAEAARRDEIRKGNALDISGNLENGRPAFADADGRVVGPAQLQKELIAGGMDRNDAAIAAGQRYRDMFDLPNAKSQGWGMRGGQRDAVLNAPAGLREDGSSPRMEVMQQLRDARRDNLQELSRQRKENPKAYGFSGRDVGTLTEISRPDGQVLAFRAPTEEQGGFGKVAANGRTARPGVLELTDAGERAIRDRSLSTTASPKELGLLGATNLRGQAESNQMAPVYETKDDNAQTARVVTTGRTGTDKGGTGVGGVSLTDQLKAQGKLAPDFQLTKEQRTGEAPLPKVYEDARNEMLANAKGVAQQRGQLDSTSSALLDRMPAGTAGRIDRQENQYDRDQQVRRENKLGNDFLNAYEQAGGKLGAVKPDAKSPGARTGAEMSAMKEFLDKAPGERDTIVDGLTKPKDELDAASKRKKKSPVSNI
jgi:hypothetical protein